MASPGQVKLQDSNISNTGGKAHHKAKLEAAKHEKAFKGAGKKVGLEIWRVENEKATTMSGPKFGIKKWPKKFYGTFYDGDSFIILSTVKSPENENKLQHDIYYWLGPTSSQDELGVAAYKTVELDELLGGEPSEHRVIGGYERKDFLKLFKKPIVILSGGVESGFHHVTPETYKPRLLWIKGSKKLKNVRVMQIEPHAKNMNHGDVFILDLGLKLFQFNGKNSGMWEKEKARETSAEIRSDRNGKPTLEVLDDLDNNESNDEFFNAIAGSENDIQIDGPPDESVQPRAKALFRCSDSSGKLKFNKISQGSLKMSQLKSNDVFIVDGGIEIYVWVGKKASKAERRKAMPMVEQFMKEMKLNKFTPISKVVEGTKSLPLGFQEAFNGTGDGGEETMFTQAANSCCVIS